MRGHRARVFITGGGAWTARGVDISRVRPLLVWLRTKHGSVKAVAQLLGMPVSTVRGYMYKSSIQRVPGPAAEAIASSVLAHRSRRPDPLASQWELDEVTRWRAQRSSRSDA